MENKTGPERKQKAGRPKKHSDNAVVVYTRVTKEAYEYLSQIAKEVEKPMSDVIILAIELMKNNGVIIERSRKVIRGDHAATPAPDGD